MRRKTSLVVVMAWLSLAACQNQKGVKSKVEMVDNKPSALLLDGQGQPIPCSDEQDCEGYVPTDNCLYGAACHRAFCEALIYDTCCQFDLEQGQVVCPAFTPCGNDDECDDGKECTTDDCNLYVLGGVCTHAPAYRGETPCGTGICQRTVPRCKDGDWNPEECVPGEPAASESCDGLDNDCDSATDEDWPELGNVCSVGQGECLRSGALVCKMDGSGTECDAQPGQPISEICDGLDNDCDGQADEDWPELGNACSVGQGECLRNGALICKVDGSGTECDAQPGQPADEVCDLKANDCDGSTDEGLGSTTCGVGECQRTVENCINGVPQVCVPGEPVAELCDLKDNDCDNATDEDLGSTTCGVGECQRTVQNCVDGVLQVCTPGSPVVEVCDNKDNDCDSLTDESLSRSCGTDVGECQMGIETCSAGAWVNCSAIGPVAEVCDNKDNDCDQLTDESLSRPCGTDVGECSPGIEACVAGVWDAQTCTALGPTPELCDGLDNDCDNETDEGDACSTCNVNFGPVECGETFQGAYLAEDNWLNGYSCRPLLNESGSEAVFVYETQMGGVKVKVQPVNVNPANANLDIFVLVNSCQVSACLGFGYTLATFSPLAEATYYVVVDGYNGASAVFDLAVTCQEMDCDDGLDNDEDGQTDCDDADCGGCLVEDCDNGLDDDGDSQIDCADSDCRFDGACLSTCVATGSISCGQSKSGTTVGGVNLISGYTCAAFDESGPEKVYSFIAPFNGSATARLSGLSADLDVVVLGSQCRADACIALGNNAASFAITSGQTYYLVVDGFAGNSGTYTLNLSCSQ